ncbi:Crp/Fnr family transcriptional regulator [Thiorhodovibrio frisius]|uniref:cAMP-binding protein n=1 Tax=Thiorhodovibrio frisius TaxID=631362 RepID=H8YYU6_9GAMM|nr:cyclic nucleotide-binding domain-containing protein [Thiorhodovibrio frisius]EIC23622.1 cAMP-binding protein [Thiorhodovibrio frisius]WPL23291.1 Anaerobic regulatory protein [Thiorhodovibrio frisius]
MPPDEALRQAPLLAQLSDQQLERLRAKAQIVQVQAGQWLFTQNDPAEFFYFVHSGQIRLFRLSAEGEEKIIELIGAGQTFAEALMFMGTGRYPVCAAALVPTELVAIDATDFTAMLRESPETCFALLGSLSQRLHALIAEIDNLALHSASVRFARWLIAELPIDTDELTLAWPKSTLASRLTIKPETWSRITRRLSEQQVIAVHGQVIRVLDRKALQQLGDSGDPALIPARQARKTG